MILPYAEDLNTGYLARLFDNTSECYKFFWFKVIVNSVCEGKLILTYQEIIDKMITDAWYMVTEYHLKLGPKDNLQAVIELISSINPSLKSSEKESVILDYLASCKDKDVIKTKNKLYSNVPYRMQAPFLPEIKGDGWNCRYSELAEKINQGKRLIYYFEAIDGMASRIRIDEDWAEYIKRNGEILLGWINYNMIQYLQKRNPSVPGIADKLYPPQERKLEKVKKYWKSILSVEQIHEIFNDEALTKSDLSIDHFVPWSYVAHDEFWNLSPTTKSINSSKSNYLPKWKLYFPKLSRLEYKSYELMWKYDSIHKEFENCAKEHINNSDVLERIYCKGLSYEEFAKRLATVIRPVYKAAHNCGFEWNWEYKDINK